MIRAFLFSALLAGPALAQHPGPHHQHHHGHTGHKAGHGDHATMNHRFTDVDWAVKHFDHPDRAKWQKPAELVAALKIAPGATVADLGAGTGYFLEHLSAAVGAAGTVFALEVELPMLGHIRQRAEKAGWTNVVPVLASFDRARLPHQGVDLALMVNVFHHVDGRVAWAKKVMQTLKPGARFVAVEFKPGPLPVGPPEGHKLPAAQIKKELLEAGFAFVEALEILPHQNVLVFRRP